MREYLLCVDGHFTIENDEDSEYLENCLGDSGMVIDNIKGFYDSTDTNHENEFNCLEVQVKTLTAENGKKSNKQYNIFFDAIDAVERIRRDNATLLEILKKDVDDKS